MSQEEPTIPGIIGGMNLPKTVIENKVDVLTFLEILVRKEVITAKELDEVREAVVAHLNAMFPALELAYTTPDSMAKQAGMEPKPLQGSVAASAFQPAQSNAGTMAASAFTSGAAKPAAVTPPAAPAAPKKEAPTAPAKPASTPLYYQAPPPKFIK